MPELDKYGVPFKYNPSIIKVGARVQINNNSNVWGGGLNGLKPGDKTRIKSAEQKNYNRAGYNYWVCLDNPIMPDSDWAYAGCFSILPPKVMNIDEDGSFRIEEEC